MSDPVALLFGECGCCSDGKGRSVFAKKNFSGFTRWHPSIWGSYGDPASIPGVLDFYHDVRYLTQIFYEEWQITNLTPEGYATYNRTTTSTYWANNGQLKNQVIVESCDANPIYEWDLAADGTIILIDRRSDSGTFNQPGNEAIRCPSFASGGATVHSIGEITATTWHRDEYLGDTVGAYPTPDGKLHNITTITLTGDYSLAQCASDAEALLALVDFDDSRFSTDGMLFVYWRGDIVGFDPSVPPIYLGQDPGANITAAAVNSVDLARLYSAGWDIDLGLPDDWPAWLYNRCYGYSCLPFQFECGFAAKNGTDGGASSLKHSCPPLGAFRLINDQQSRKWVMAMKSQTAANVVAGETCVASRSEHQADESDTGHEWDGNETCALSVPPLVADQEFSPSDIAYEFGTLNLQKPDDKVHCCQNESSFVFCCTLPP